ncbi:CSMD [Mytilus edulis]|uniref:CSMD n=1 Tax=Mytilus edulis TaxID=6550 RepID=A0A8S3SVI0_MYTED|nr:CSMD [Mytilus edulis]
MSLISHIGPTMCTNKCKSLYGCNGVNFDRHQLTCELLRIYPTTEDISEKAGSMFAALSSLQPVVIFVKTIRSTNYPAAYPNNDRRSWSLDADNNTRLVLKFKAFKMEAGPDYLRIYDRLGGIQLYSLTGFLNPDDIWSKANGFYITFRSDGSVTYSGFSIDVYKTS